MLEILFNERVTVRKPGPLDITGQAEEDVLRADDGTIARMRCAIERRGRRVTTRDGTEIVADATILFRRDRWPGNQLVVGSVVEDGEARRYRLLSYEEVNSFGALYWRAPLSSTREDVKKDPERAEA